MSLISRSITTAAHTIKAYAGTFTQSLGQLHRTIQQHFIACKTEENIFIADVFMLDIKTATFKLDEKNILLSAPKVDQRSEFPVFANEFFGQGLPFAEGSAKVKLSLQYKKLFSSFTGSEEIKQLSIAIFTHLNRQYLMKYRLVETMTTVSSSFCIPSQTHKDLKALQESLQLKIARLISRADFQALQEKNEQFIRQQHALLTQFVIDLTKVSKKWRRCAGC